MKAHSKSYRRLAKTLTWRVTTFAATALLAWLICGKIDKAVGIGAAEFIFIIAFYYGQERLWERISWGIRTNEQ
jgi:uncharacterized membrane protein